MNPNKNGGTAMSTANTVQTRRFSDAEIQLAAGIFGASDMLPRLFRKRMLQLPLTDDEITVLKAHFPENEPITHLMKKILSPEIDGDAPFYQPVDLYHWAKVEDQHEEIAVISILSREIMKSYLDHMFTRLYDFDTPYLVDFKKLTEIKDYLGKDERVMVANFLARKKILEQMDLQLHQFWILAAAQYKTDEQKAEQESRKKKNSNK